MNLRKYKYTQMAWLLILSTLLSSCGTTSTTQPVQNTELRLLGTDRNIVDGKLSSPWDKIDLSTRLIYRNIFTMEYGSDEIKPDLAKSYTSTPDGLSHTIEFRDDLLWSDGEPITIEDVVFSFETILLADSKVYILANSFTSIQGAEQFVKGEADHVSGLMVDGNTLTITLEKPIASFIKTLTQFAILPKHALEDEDPANLSQSTFWNAPVVSGMYQFDSYIDGEQLKYTYNNEYVDAVPNIESIVLRSDYAYNEVDCFTTNDIEKVQEFRSIPKMREMDIDTLFYRYIVYNTIKDGDVDPVIGDIRVRQAIAYALNVEELVSEIFYNTAHIIESGGVLLDSTNLDGLSPKYDPEKATALLAEAEYDFDRPLTLLYYYTDATTIRLIHGIAENLEAVGFTVNLVPDGDLYSSEFDHYDIALKGLAAFDIFEWYMEYHSSHNMYQYVYGQEPMFDALIDELNRTTTPQEREEVLNQLQLKGFEAFYKFPMFLLGYKAYVNTSRLSIPEDVVLGNPEYRYDVHFEEWEIIQ